MIGALFKGGLQAAAFKEMLKAIHAEQLKHDELAVAFKEASRASAAAGSTVLRAAGSLPDGSQFTALIVIKG